MLNVLLAGQKYFGFEVFNSLAKIGGVNVACVSCPVEKKEDRLHQIASQKGIKIIKAGSLNADTMPDGIDLIIAAHSHDFIGEKTRMKSKHGAIGYHPSLLPLHKGRDSIEWALRMGDKVTGGTVFRLSNKVDGGPILKQEHIFVRPKDDARELWRRDLLPLGVRLITEAVNDLINNGYTHGREQDKELSTWEPAINQPPLYRPDLIMLGYYDEVVESNKYIAESAIEASNETNS